LEIFLNRKYKTVLKYLKNEWIKNNAYGINSDCGQSYKLGDLLLAQIPQSISGLNLRDITC
jgi:hypothetical protein